MKEGFFFLLKTNLWNERIQKIKKTPETCHRKWFIRQQMAATKVEREEGSERLEFEWGARAPVLREARRRSTEVKLFIIANLARTRDRLAEIWCKLAETTRPPCRGLGWWMPLQSQSELETALFLCTSRSQRWVDGSNSIKRFLRIYQALAQRGIDPSPSVELVRAARRHLFLSAQQFCYVFLYRLLLTARVLIYWKTWFT